MNNYWVKQHDRFHENYAKASTAVKEFIDSDTILSLVQTTCVRNPSLNEHKGDIRNIFIYRALNTISDEQILAYLNNIGIDAGISKLILVEINESLEKLEATELNTTIETAQEIIEAEAELETISPIRTMAGDSNQKEEIYSSHQSAILNERK